MPQEQMHLIVALTSSGRYNVIGTAEEKFIVQGNMTYEQLSCLRDQIDKELNKRAGNKKGASGNGRDWRLR